MNCNEVLSSYSDYLDGEFLQNTEQEYEDHLASCERCENYHSILSMGLEEFRSLPDIEVSDHFHLRLQHKILHVEEEERRKVGRPTIFRALEASFAPTLSAVAVFAFLVFFFAPKIGFDFDSTVVPENLDKGTNDLATESLDKSQEKPGTNNFSELNNSSTAPTISRLGDSRISYYSSSGRTNNLMLINRPQFSDRISFGKSYSPPISKSSTTSPISKISSHITNGSGYRLKAISKLGIYVTQYLGDHVSEELAALENLNGLSVEKIVQFGPAYMSGLMEGDIIISYEGYPIKTTAELINHIKSSDWGIKRLGLIRDGRKMEVYLFL